MTQYINKDTLVAEIEKLIANGKEKCQQSKENNAPGSYIAWSEHIATCGKILSYINTLEVKDPYEQIVQYDSIKVGIQAHAETYSFNIESKLFNQLTEEQQKLWRKEIEQACISGGEVGVELARDTCYKENLEVKEVDLEKEIDKWYNTKASKEFENVFYGDIEECAKYFFELGLNAQQNIHIDITSIDKVIKENGIDPNSKEAKIFKESYYIALEKLKARKGE